MTVVAGVVRSDPGGPLAGATVLFSGAPVAVPDIAALTDEHGRFALTAPAPGDYELTVTAGERTAIRRVHVAPADERVEIEIDMGARST